jgi:hypothetical protein
LHYCYRCRQSIYWLCLKTWIVDTLCLPISFKLIVTYSMYCYVLLLRLATGAWTK